MNEKEESVVLAWSFKGKNRFPSGVVYLAKRLIKHKYEQ